MIAPKKPRYELAFDTLRLFRYLRDLGDSAALSPELLRRRFLILFLLHTLGRQQLMNICAAGGVKLVRKRDKALYLQYSAYRGKTWRPGDADFGPQHFIKEYPKDPRICTVQGFIWMCLSMKVWPTGWTAGPGWTEEETMGHFRRHSKRKLSQSFPFNECAIGCLDNTKPFAETSCKLEVTRSLEASGIDTELFKPYSTVLFPQQRRTPKEYLSSVF